MTSTVLIVALIIAIFTLSGTILLLGWYIRRKFRFTVQQTIAAKNDIRHVLCISDAIRSIPLTDAILPMPSSWSISGPALRILSREIDSRRPRLVVELGSGLSTIATALKLRELGCGRVVSIDHDPQFAAQTRAFLRLNGVDPIAEVRIASLCPMASEQNLPPWYSTDELNELADIDILIVDGPPAPVNPMVRAPALPFFFDRLSPNALILLDDADRAGEKKILEEWKAQHPSISIEVIPGPDSLAMITLERHA